MDSGSAFETKHNDIFIYLFLLGHQVFLTLKVILCQSAHIQVRYGFVRLVLSFVGGCGSESKLFVIISTTSRTFNFLAVPKMKVCSAAFFPCYKLTLGSYNPGENENVIHKHYQHLLGGTFSCMLHMLLHSEWIFKS